MSFLAFCLRIFQQALLLVLGFSAFVTFGQAPHCLSGKEGNIWYFGDSLGLDFNTLPPTVLTDSKMSSYEAGAIVSDAGGNLLFYSNGEHVWNRNHEVMPGVTGTFNKLKGSESATHILAVPHPGDPALYYLFYMETFDNVAGQPADTLRNMYYAVIDMNADGGLGDVVSKDNVLFSKTTEKVAATRHCNGRDWWVLALESGSNRFMAWLIDENGLQPNPVLSEIGKVNQSFGAGKAGALKFSSNGSTLIKVQYSRISLTQPWTLDAYSELFRFDNSNGNVFDPVVVIDSVRRIYGAEFSPDNTKLYFNAWTPSDSLYQYDLCVYDVAAIRQSKINLGKAASNTGQIQLAPDGKIYLTSTFREFLSIIHRPNEKGLSCQYQPEAILLPRDALLGLPTFPASYYAPGKPYISGEQVCASVCADSLRRYYVTGQCDAGASYTWTVTGGTVTAQQQDTVWVQWQQPGVQQVAVRKVWDCGQRSDTLRVEVEDCKSCIPTTNALNVSVCAGEIFDYNGTAIPAGQSQQFILQNAAGCDSVVTVTVTELPVSAAALNVSVCAGEVLNYNGTTIPAGQSQQFILQNAVGCDSVVTVTVAELPVSNTALNVSVCAGEVFDYNGTQLMIGQSQSFVFQNYLGCDSTVTVTVGESETSYYILDALACEGDSLLFDGVWIPVNSSHIFTYQNSVGCDSVVEVAVGSFGPPQSSALAAVVCPGETYAYNGQQLASGTTADVILSNIWGCDSIVTVTVTAFSVTAEFLEATICPGETFLFNGIEVPAGDTVVFHFSTPEGCDSTVTVAANTSPVAAFECLADKTCSTQPDGSIAVVNATGGVPPYRYSLDGLVFQDSPFFEQLPEGDYTIFLKDSIGCVFENEVTMSAFASLTVGIPDGILPCDSSGTRLEAAISGDLTDLKTKWFNGDTTFFTQVIEPGPVWVDVTNRCETVRAEATVHWEDIPANASYAYVPNVFKPASFDPDNSEFKPFFQPNLTIRDYRFEVFDRWGNKMFGTEQPDAGWHGTFRADDMAPGVYVWYAKVHFIFCGVEKELFLKGDVTVVR